MSSSLKQSNKVNDFIKAARIEIFDGKVSGFYLIEQTRLEHYLKFGYDENNYMVTKEGQKEILPKRPNYLTADQSQQLADFLA